MTSSRGGQRVVPMRLQKFLARAGVASRRGSENLMTAGRVSVNGTVVTELGSKVDPAVDVVEVDGRRVELADGPVVLLLNKPAGVLTTMKRQSEKPIVADIVPTDAYPGLYPIGRLDADTTGVLLFTTDGELGHGLLHPSHHVDKTYRAQVKGRLSDEELAHLQQGVRLVRMKDGVEVDDGISQPCEAHVAGSHACGDTVVLTVHEGKYHQVKRMLAGVGHPVLALERVSFGPIGVGDLPPGAWRLLDEHEEALLRACLPSC